VGERLRGLRVLEVNATPYGGGVSELLRAAVPLLNDLGLRVDWKIIRGDNPFFNVTKAMHNGLQGAKRDLTAEERQIFLGNAHSNAAALDEEESYDIIVVHDPQPVAMLPLRGKNKARWIWRCHIDTSAPNPSIWEFVRPFLTEYDAAIFTLQEFVPPDMPNIPVVTIPPAIDPLSPKNLPLGERTARQILGWLGVNLSRPLVTQVSRFDPWKDPMGVIEAYRLAREEIPNLQLALVGSMAMDDPEGWEIYRAVQEQQKGDPLMWVLSNLNGVSNIEVNAVQRISDVCIQKSLREGFGLVVSETLWKGTPMVATRAGGLVMQMPPGVGGYLVHNVEECAKRLVQLVGDPQEAEALGQIGRDYVREHFLMPRLLLDHLRLMERVMK
jgi:trehalose synthase